MVACVETVGGGGFRKGFLKRFARKLASMFITSAAYTCTNVFNT
jgi:hypothetical protein